MMSTITILGVPGDEFNDEENDWLQRCHDDVENVSLDSESQRICLRQQQQFFMGKLMFEKKWNWKL